MHTEHFDKSIILPFFFLQLQYFYFLYFRWHSFIYSLNFYLLLELKFFISSFVVWNYFSTFESIKALEIRNSMLFNLGFANNIILSCFFFFLLIIDLHFIIPAVIAQSFNPIAELVIPTGCQLKNRNQKWKHIQ